MMNLKIGDRVIFISDTGSSEELGTILDIGKGAYSGQCLVHWEVTDIKIWDLSIYLSPVSDPNNILKEIL